MGFGYILSLQGGLKAGNGRTGLKTALSRWFYPAGGVSGDDRGFRFRKVQQLPLFMQA